MAWWDKPRSGKHLILGIGIFIWAAVFAMLLGAPRPSGIRDAASLLIFGGVTIVMLYRLLKEYRTPPL